MTLEDAAWAHLGQCLREARAGEPRDVVAKRAGVSRAQIQRYEEGKVHPDIPDRLYRLARHYGWTPDSVRRVLRGEEPTYMPPLPPMPAMPAEVRARLQQVMEDQEASPAAREYARLLLAGGNPE